MKRGKCHGCGAEVLWIETPAGKNMPCNPKPVPYWVRPKAPGKIVTQHGQVISCDLEGDSQTITGLGYIAHWATCPAAKKFKR